MKYSQKWYFRHFMNSALNRGNISLRMFHIAVYVWWVNIYILHKIWESCCRVIAPIIEKVSDANYVNIKICHAWRRLLNCRQQTCHLSLERDNLPLLLPSRCGYQEHLVDLSLIILGHDYKRTASRQPIWFRLGVLWYVSLNRTRYTYHIFEWS